MQIKFQKHLKMKKLETRIIESFQKKEKKFIKQYFFSAILQKFSQLENYSRWKINILSIFSQHKILYQKIKTNFIFEILKITFFRKNYSVNIRC